MHRDPRLVVEGHPPLPVGVILVPLRVQDRCRFGLVRSAEGLLQEPKEVCALGVRPGHGLQCGGLGVVVGDRGFVEAVDAGVGFRRGRLLGTASCGGGLCPARAPSGVEEVDDGLSCGRLAVPLWDCGTGHALGTLPLYSVPVRCSVSGVHSYIGTISRPVRSCQSSMVRPTFLSLGVARSHLTWILNAWWSPVTRYRCLTSPAAHIHLEGPAAVAFSKGSCTRVPMVFSGYRAAAPSAVRLFGLAGGLAAGLACVGAFRFFAPWRRRALGRTCWGGAPWGCCTAAWPGANMGCSRVAGTSGLDVGTASLSCNTCLVMMPRVSSACCRASGGSVGQVRSRCLVPALGRRMSAR